MNDASIKADKHGFAPHNFPRMAFFFLFILSILLSPRLAYANTVSLGFGFSFFYGNNFSAAGLGSQLRISLPVGPDGAATISLFGFDTFGKVSGLRLGYEYRIISTNRSENTRDSFEFSSWIGVSYGLYLIDPVFMTKDSPLVETPSWAHDFGITGRPIQLREGQFVAATLDNRYSRSIVPPAERFNSDLGIMTIGFQP